MTQARSKATSEKRRAYRGRPKRRASLLFVAASVFAFAGAFAVVHAFERPALDVEALEAIARGPTTASPTPADSKSDDLSVDLHAHLFMKPGMTFLWRGGFFGPLRAGGWRSRFGSQANPQSVERSRIGIVVVALYANPIFTWRPRSAVREEIRQAELFVAQHPGWMIARTPREAREAISQGKRALVLSLERASWVIENDADIREFVDEKGVRIVTLLHLTDDRFGGAAMLKGFRQLSNPLRWFVHVFRPRFGRDGVKVNPRGLTSAGRIMARKLIERGVWLDLSHSSDAAQQELIPMLKEAKHPLLYTHGGLRRFVRAERGLSDEQLEAVRETGGIVGICPSEDVVNPTAVPRAFCGGAGCASRCNHGLPAFVAHYSEAARVLGASSVMVGTDFNGAIPHLPPTCGTGTSLDREGLWNIGQMGEFWEAARKLGAPVPERVADQVDTFIEKWSRVSVD